MESIDHIAIAIPQAEAVSLWEKLLGAPPFHVEEVPAQGVKVYFFQVGPTKVELIEPLSPESAVARFIEKKGGGLHHIAFYTENLIEEINRLRDMGFSPLQDTPQPAALGKQAVFFHPKTFTGVLVELVSFP
ncbi:MAG: methylmalonyl-CoA epimerase [Bacteroidia bacterium]|nr:methylmalonyl-CoA epimerase [Bacteroidia bacterium]